MTNSSEKSGSGISWKEIKDTYQWFSAIYNYNYDAVCITNSDIYFIELNHVTLIRSLKYVKNWFSKK
jgi:hypothetical protein